MTEAEVQKLLSDEKWIFAKSMPKIPHEYTRKREWKNPELFYDVAKFIMDNGAPETFWKRTYSYYRYNGKKYWVMDADAKDCTLINRALI